AWSTLQPLRGAVYGIEFSVAQEAVMAQIWLLLDAVDIEGAEDAEEEDDDGDIDQDDEGNRDDGDDEDEDDEDDEDEDEESTRLQSDDGGLRADTDGTIDLDLVLGQDQYTSLESP
ncbi:hypothetical protein V491_00259, partial [Pseudogymnoascus sp. VKM F-3775]